MDMPGRTTPPPGSIGQYRYGMNGQMKDGDVFEGFMSADFWGYDARLGRRWEQDPLARDWQSPYCTFDNNPIVFSDPDGLEAKDGPKKGEKYDCGDGTYEVFDGKKYVPEGVDGKPMELPNFAKIEFAKQNFYEKGKIIAKKGQVVSYNIKGETFRAQYGSSAGTKGTKFFGYFNDEGETYQGNQDVGENIINGSKHWYNGYSGPNSNSTQKAWQNWLTFYNYSQFLRGIGFEVIEGVPAIWNAVINRGGYYAGTQIPKYFTLICKGGKKFFITANAIEHIIERFANNPLLSSEYKNLVGQIMIQSMHGALNKILTKNKGVIQYGVKYVEGGWEIIFAAPRNPGELPAVKHALPLF